MSIMQVVAPHLRLYFFLFWQILLSRTIHFLSNILTHQANVFFVSLRTHEEHWGVTFTKCFNKCFGIFRLWMAYFWPSLASCSSQCYYSCLTASGAVAQRDLITRDAIIHRGWCQYYDNFTFHSPPRWSPDWKCLISQGQLRPMRQWEWFSSSSCAHSKLVIILSRLAGTLITLQGEERVSERTEVAPQGHHLSLCEGMTTTSVQVWNLVHEKKKRAVVQIRFPNSQVWF